MTTSTPSTPETKPENSTSILNKPEDKAAATKPAEGVPEKYDFKAPEGFEIDPVVVAEVTPLFKELGLNQANAQRLVDFYNTQTQKVINAPYKLYEDMRSGWRNEVTKDPALGDGQGNVKSEVRATIGRALDQLGDAKLTADFKAAMDLTGAGDNPAFVRVFHKLASLVTEGTNVVGRGPSPLGQRSPNAKPGSAAQAMYPNLPSSAIG